MKIFLLLLLFPVLTFAASSGNPWTYRLDTSVTNLPATYPAGPQLAGPGTAFTLVQAINTTASEIEINCSSSVSPSIPNVTSISIPSQTAYTSPNPSNILVPLGKVCWIRSYSGTISSGIVEIVGWGY